MRWTENHPSRRTLVVGALGTAAAGAASIAGFRAAAADRGLATLTRANPWRSRRRLAAYPRRARRG